jgi:hypothetical protein
MIHRPFKDDSAFKAAVEARLRSHALERGISLQHIRQLLVFDRLLVRLQDAFGRRILLKGGVVLETRLERARATKDLDVSLAGDVTTAWEELADAAERDVGDRITFEVSPRRGAHTVSGPGVLYGGARCRAQAFLNERPFGDPFGLDVVFGYLQSGEPDLLLGRGYLAPLGFPSPVLRVTNRETHIAEKFHAYSMPMRDNSRTKDLPDIALLASIGPLEASRVQAALGLIFSVRRTHALPLQVPDPPGHWVKSYGVMAKADKLPWDTLPAVTSAARAFLNPVLAGCGGAWNPATWSWELV